VSDDLFDCEVRVPILGDVGAPCFLPGAAPKGSRPVDSQRAAILALIRDFRDGMSITLARRVIDGLAAAEFLPGTVEERVLTGLRLATALGQLDPQGFIPAVSPRIKWDNWLFVLRDRGFSVARPMLGGLPTVVVPPVVLPPVYGLLGPTVFDAREAEAAARSRNMAIAAVVVLVLLLKKRKA
jgi:hypothetical protein